MTTKNKKTKVMFKTFLLPAVCLLALMIAMPSPARAESIGSIEAWGRDNYGQATPPDGNDFVAVSAGANHSLALKTDGSIVGWGSDNFGQTSATPTGKNFVAVSAGVNHSIALKTDDSIEAWGYDAFGQTSDTPTGNDFKAISAGGTNNLALKTDGSIEAWGDDEWGQVSGTPIGNDFVAVSAGVRHSIALREDGSIEAWGNDYNGQTSGTPTGNDFVAISAGWNHSLALKTDGSIEAWGDDEFGQVSGTPIGNDFVAISAGVSHSLALKKDGSIVGWGYDSYGQTTDTPTGNDFVAVSAGGSHSLALKAVSTAKLTTTKAKVDWDKDKFEVTGEIPYPTKPDINLSYQGSAGVKIAGVEVSDPSVVYALTLTGKNDDKWEYKVKDPDPGYLKEYKVEWKQAKFDWRNKDTYGKLHFHTHSIADGQTTFCIHSEAEHWPMRVKIGGGIIVYRADGDIYTKNFPQGFSYEPQRDDNTHVHFELGFKLESDTEITVDLPGTANDFELITCEYYKEAYLKYKVKGYFEGITSSATPTTVAYHVNFSETGGSALFGGADTIGDDEYWIIFDSSKWEYTTRVYGSCDATGDVYYAIGDTGPAGGIVFYITDGGLHGLEAAPSDQSTVAEWGCYGTAIPGADGTAVGTGAQNTADILAGCSTAGIAAAIADAYTLNGYDDWFLPSIDELNLLYLQKDIVGGFTGSLFYWSSTEEKQIDTLAWYQFFYDGYLDFGNKINLFRVRAIRAF